MRFIDKFMTRGRHQPRFDTLAQRVQNRLAPVCQDLGKAEQALAEHLDMPQPPRLLIIDEENAAVLTYDERPGTD